MRNIMPNYKYMALPAGLALMLGMPLAANAQEAAEDPGQHQRGNAETDIDSATKDKFITAYVEIRDVQQEYTKKLQNVEDKSKAQQLQEQAQAEMVDIVEDNGLTVKEYNQLVNAIGNDPELRQEIEQKVQEQ